MPRTTIDIDAPILRELKQLQRRQGTSLGRLASDLLARALAAPRTAAPRRGFRWHSQSMGARVDLDDKEALWAALDRHPTGGKTDKP